VCIPYFHRPLSPLTSAMPPFGAPWVSEAPYVRAYVAGRRNAYTNAACKKLSVNCGLAHVMRAAPIGALTMLTMEVPRATPLEALEVLQVIPRLKAHLRRGVGRALLRVPYLCRPHRKLPSTRRSPRWSRHSLRR